MSLCIYYEKENIFSSLENVVNWSSFQFSFVKSKSKQSQQPIGAKMDIIVSQWELKVKVKKLHEKPGKTRVTN